MPQRTTTVREITQGALLGCIVCALYLVTAPRGLWGSDGGEFALAAVELGLTHAPGYPLYVLIGHLFFQITGNAMWGMTLFSALSAGFAVAVLFCTLRLLRLGTMAASLAAIYFGVYHSTWQFAIQPEVYTPSVLCFGLSLHLLLLDREHDHSWYLYASSVALGLSCAVYAGNIFAIPAWVYLLAQKREDRTKRLAVFFTALTACAAAMAAWAYVRSGSHPPITIEYVPHSLSNLVRYLTGAEFSAVPGVPSVHQSLNPEGLGAAGVYAKTFVRNWLGVGVLYALFGLAVGWGAQRTLQLYFVILFAVISAYWAPKGYAGTLGMALQAAYVFAIWIAMGMNGLAERASKPLLRYAGMAPIILAVIGLMGFHLRRYQEPPSAHFVTEEAGLAMVDAFPQDAVVFAPWREFSLLLYIQRVRDVRTDLVFVEAERRPLFHPEFGRVVDWRPVVRNLVGKRTVALHPRLLDGSELKETLPTDRLVTLSNDWIAVHADVPAS